MSNFQNITELVINLWANISIMEKDTGIKIVRDIIRNNLRHKNYQRTVALAKEYKSFITGEGIEEYMKKFPRRETEAEFMQRVALTINITPTVCKSLIEPQRKVSRSNSIEKSFLYTDNDEKKYDELKRISSKFWKGRKSLEQYMSNVWIEKNNIDPNAFCVADWKMNKDGERIVPYPVEYGAESVYHYQLNRGELEWICVHRNETKFDPEMYILYARNFTVIFSKTEVDPLLHNYEADSLIYKEKPIDSIHGDVATYKQDDMVYWNINIPVPHNLGHVPGDFFGHVRDLTTDGQTYVSVIHDAFPLLKKIVKSNSELDFSMLLHAFQQKVVFVDPCKACNGKGRTREGVMCEVCEGTGQNPEQVHKSSLDIIKITRPRDMSREETMPLRDMVHYVQLDTRLLKFQEEYVEKLTKKCKEAVYNSEVFSRKDVAETAYGKNIDLQHVYDALWDLAVNFAEMQTFLMHTIADITDLNKNLIYKISFRKDFKMKGLTELYNDLTLVGNSQADEFVKKAIEDDIAQVLYESDERELMKYKTMNYFFPFNGKTKKEIEIIVTNTTLVREETRILWSNFSYIFDELELEWAEKKVDFYMLNRMAQKQAIDAKVKDILESIEKSKPDIYVGENIFGDAGQEQQTEEQA